MRGMTWLAASVIAVSLSTVSLSVAASDAALLKETQQAKVEQAKHNQAREGEFKQREQALQAELDKLNAQLASLKQENEQLSETFQQNEAVLAEKEQALHLATGSLGELFGVVRQAAKDLDLEQAGSVATLGQAEHRLVVEEIVAARQLPAKRQLYGLWQAFAQQIQASAEAQMLNVDVINGQGETETKSVLRLGSFALAGEQGYLDWNGQRQRATVYAQQPQGALTLSTDVTSGLPIVALDASRGALLEQLGMAPTLLDRIEHGGIVGKVIIALLLVGMAIGLVRGAALLSAKAKIAKQLKHTDSPQDDNALGRILNVYRQDSSPNVEALELRLLEAVMDEQQHLERGLSMIKLLAALAPMLGLLGTVTGMIDTFQTITQFGNADPRVMAGGISMALITTVLGLIAAMPLLLIHNILASKAEAIRTIIEKQGIGLVAERAEQATRLVKDAA